MTGIVKTTADSRKLVGYVLLVISVLATLALTTFMNTPTEIADTGLYMIGAGGLFTIGGQALVDSVGKWRVPGSNEPHE